MASGYFAGLRTRQGRSTRDEGEVGLRARFRCCRRPFPASPLPGRGGRRPARPPPSARDSRARGRSPRRSPSRVLARTPIASPSSSTSSMTSADNPENTVPASPIASIMTDRDISAHPATTESARAVKLTDAGRQGGHEERPGQSRRPRCRSARHRRRPNAGCSTSAAQAWQILRKLRCYPLRAGQNSKAIHVLQSREIGG